MFFYWYADWLNTWWLGVGYFWKTQMFITELYDNGKLLINLNKIEMGLIPFTVVKK
jgi:hypothetical protein